MVRLRSGRTTESDILFAQTTDSAMATTSEGNSGPTSSPSPSPTATRSERVGDSSDLQGINPSNVKVHHDLDPTGTNFCTYKKALWSAADSKRCVSALESPMPGTPQDRAALVLISTSVPKKWHVDISMTESAYEAFLMLERKFVGGHNLRINSVWLAEMRAGMNEEETIEDYYKRMMTLRHCLIHNGQPLVDRSVALSIIEGLPPEAKTVGIESSAHNTPLSELLGVLESSAEARRFNDAVPRKGKHQSSTTAAASGPVSPMLQGTSSSSGGGRGGGRQGRGGGRQGPPQCYTCGQSGHIGRNCPNAVSMAQLQEQVRNLTAQLGRMQPPGGTNHAAGAAYPGFWEQPPPPGNPIALAVNALGPNSRSPLPSTWMVDSGASVHLVKDLSLLHNPCMHAQPIPLTLATSGGQSKILATGSVCLQNQKGQWVWLSNVHYVPDTVENLLSVSAAIQDGLSFRTDFHGAPSEVLGPHGWTCPVTAERGLYFLQWVSLIPPLNHTVMSSYPGHNCQRSMLWHHRLGHPGQHNSIRLDREELVNGLPVPIPRVNNVLVHVNPASRGSLADPPSGRVSTLPQKCWKEFT